MRSASWQLDPKVYTRSAWVSQNSGYPFRGSYARGSRILGFILGSPFRKIATYYHLPSYTGNVHPATDVMCCIARATPTQLSRKSFSGTKAAVNMSKLDQEHKAA